MACGWTVWLAIGVMAPFAAIGLLLAVTWIMIALRFDR